MKAVDIVRERFPNVDTVVDAERPITIEVTKRDSNSAQVKRHQDCAMAVACKRQLKSCDGVMISLTSAYIIQGNKAIRFSVPEAVGREITSFDRKAGFAPGTYQLASVPPASRLGSRSQKRGNGGGSHTSTGKGIAKRFAHHTDDVRSKLGSKEYKAGS